MPVPHVVDRPRPRRPRTVLPGRRVGWVFDKQEAREPKLPIPFAGGQRGQDTAGINGNDHTRDAACAAAPGDNLKAPAEVCLRGLAPGQIEKRARRKAPGFRALRVRQNEWCSGRGAMVGSPDCVSGIQGLQPVSIQKRVVDACARAQERERPDFYPSAHERSVPQLRSRRPPRAHGRRISGSLSSALLLSWCVPTQVRPQEATVLCPPRRSAPCAGSRRRRA